MEWVQNDTDFSAFQVSVIRRKTEKEKPETQKNNVELVIGLTGMFYSHYM